MTRMRGPDRARAALAEASLDCEILTLPDSTRIAAQAVAALRCSPGEIAKSPGFRAGQHADELLRFSAHAPGWRHAPSRERHDGPRRYCLLPRLLSRRRRGRRGTLRFRASCSWKSGRWPTRRCSTIAHPVSVQSDFGCGESCVTVAKDAGPLGPGVPPAGGCR